ncbi:unnamed protein product [Paramecium octaurelia]|uniref:Uncharacterized protein n=1 Tax=Paramecium octaurelia TaxID=43137 RepID=A0A8S1UDJ8_PAROT|nr:unnamed protein product [Paramecium octaurelia]
MANNFLGNLATLQSLKIFILNDKQIDSTQLKHFSSSNFLTTRTQVNFIFTLIQAARQPKQWEKQKKNYDRYLNCSLSYLMFNYCESNLVTKRAFDIY